MLACLLKIAEVDPFHEESQGISNGKMHWHGLIALFLFCVIICKMVSPALILPRDQSVVEI